MTKGKGNDKTLEKMMLEVIVDLEKALNLDFDIEPQHYEEWAREFALVAREWALEEALKAVGRGGLPKGSYRSHIGTVADYAKGRSYYQAKKEIRKRIKKMFTND